MKNALCNSRHRRTCRARSTYERHIRVSCQLLPERDREREMCVCVLLCVYVMRLGCVRGKDYGNSSLNYSLKVLTCSELALLCVRVCVCVTSSWHMNLCVCL